MNIFEQAKEQLVAGIKVYVERAIREAEYDKTYFGVIVAKETDDNGEYTGTYTVAIKNEKYTNVSAINNSNKLNVGNKVMVLSPMNKLTNMVILN